MLITIECPWISTPEYDAKPYPVNGFENRTDELEELADKPLLVDNLRLYWKCLDTGNKVTLKEVPHTEVEATRKALIELITMAHPLQVLEWSSQIADINPI
jgi:hypothetical protein